MTIRLLFVPAINLQTVAVPPLGSACDPKDKQDYVPNPVFLLSPPSSFLRSSLAILGSEVGLDVKRGSAESPQMQQMRPVARKTGPIGTLWLQKQI